MKNIKVITLCGSRKFKKEFKEAEMFLTREGFAVLSPIFNDEFEITEKNVKLLGKIHLKKIQIADEILVVDVGGYIGESTKKEIDYAKKNKKKIRYYSNSLYKVAMHKN